MSVERKGPQSGEGFSLDQDFHNDPINKMTQETYQRLLASLPVLQDKVTDANKRKGEAAGVGADWHDNFAYDQAVRDAEAAEQLLSLTQEKLRRVEIIEPRLETDTVGIGNCVVVRFEDEDEDESFVLLGTDDAQTGMNKNPRWISIETKLGAALLGKSAGTKVTYETPNGEMKVKIKKIVAGEF